MQLNLLVNVRGVSHGSPPYLPVPAVLFISSAGEHEGDGFFRVGVTHSIWQQTMRHFTIFLMFAHKTVAFKLNAQKCRTAAKVEAVMGSIYLFIYSFAIPDFRLLKLKFRSWTVTSLFMERDNGLFTPAQTEGLRQAATGRDISAGMKYCITTEITEPLGFKVVYRSTYSSWTVWCRIFTQLLSIQYELWTKYSS